MNNNNQDRLIRSTSNFSDGINEALQHCEESHDSFLNILNDVDQNPTPTNSSVRNYCSIGLHVNKALQGSIRSIGHGGNILNQLQTTLSQEQRDLISNDLHGMQNEMIITCTECYAAENELWRSIRQGVEDDPMLRDDALAIQCVDEIEGYHTHLQSLPTTAESLRERSNTLQSIQSRLSVLEERVEHVNPRSPLARILRIFRKASKAMDYLLKGVLKVLFGHERQ